MVSMLPAAVEANGVRHAYGERVALDGVSFRVERGSFHAFLGPNGSGKSTLFRLLATLLPLRDGTARVLGMDLRSEIDGIRRRLGVVFQSPALDRKLPVRANLRYGGHLVGMRGRALDQRIDELLEQTGLSERAGQVVGELSGGLRRRVEIAKGLLHRPELVLLDEPSTGLDPAARADLWRLLRGQQDLTVLLTTHLMDEAGDADAITILDAGRVVAAGTPDELAGELGGEIIEIRVDDAESAARSLRETFGIAATVIDRRVRIEAQRAHELVPRIVELLGARVHRLTLAQPSLEDVFIKRTGRRLSEDER
jgi:ABC-2 type transport system ATP-binding protein